MGEAGHRQKRYLPQRCRHDHDHVQTTCDLIRELPGCLCVSYSGMDQPERITNFKRIQAPGAALANETENGANVIGQHYTRKPRTVDESRSLEDLLILFGEL
jgi:hypothetical protein